MINKKNWKMAAILSCSLFLFSTFAIMPLSSGDGQVNSFSSYSNLLDSFSLSESLTNSSVRAIQQVAITNQYNFLYNNSIGGLENASISALHTIELSQLFLTSLGFDSNVADTYLTQGESYDFLNQVFNVYLVVTIPTKDGQTALTFGFSSGNNSVYGPTISTEPDVYEYSTSPSTNWGGYEMYDPGSSITENIASVVVPTITLPSNTYGWNVAAAGWIGLSPYEGGSVPGNPNATNLIQTGFQRIFWYDILTGGYNWGAYTIWYQTWSNGTSPAYSGGYPGMPAPSNGSDIEFGMEYNGYNSVTYGVTTLNNSYTYTVTTPYYNTPNYAQYIMEAPTTDQEGYMIQSQIAKFSPNVTFSAPSLMTNSGFINLNGLVNSGDYNEFVLNQTYGIPNQNIQDNLWYESGYYVPVLVWQNSNYNLGGA